MRNGVCGQKQEYQGLHNLVLLAIGEKKVFLDPFRFLAGFEHEMHKERLIGESVQIYVIFVVVIQSFSQICLFATPWTAGFPVLHYLPEFAETHVR